MRPIEDSYVRISRRSLIEVSTSLVDGFVFPRVPIDEVRSVDSFWLVHRMPSHHVHLFFDQILVDLQLLNRSELITGVGFRHGLFYRGSTPSSSSLSPLSLSSSSSSSSSSCSVLFINWTRVSPNEYREKKMKTWKKPKRQKRGKFRKERKKY